MEICDLFDIILFLTKTSSIFDFVNICCSKSFIIIEQSKFSFSNIENIPEIFWLMIELFGYSFIKFSKSNESFVVIIGNFGLKFNKIINVSKRFERKKVDDDTFCSCKYFLHLRKIE